MGDQADWVKQLPKAARDYANGRRIEEIECIISDTPGIARGKAMPGVKFSPTGTMYLPEVIFNQTITGEYAEITDANWVTEPDSVLKPDMSTATAAPWTGDVTLQIIHDVFDRNGEPVPQVPRNVLKRVVKMYSDLGLKPVVAPEMEFYLVARNTNPAIPIEPPMGRSGRQAAARQAYSMSAVDEYGPVIDDIYDFAEAQGLEIDGIVQEGGAGQVEINLQHGDPIALADEIFFYKRLIREAALRHDCFATFMAKPMQNQPGSAMHIHHSIVDIETGKNIFVDKDNEDTAAFYHFISGLQRHLPSVVALLAPYVNSYRRYVPDFSAPTNLNWGRDNRTTGIRVPISDPEARRVENRIAGMDCNPYLGIAASLACGYLGLVEKQDPRDEMSTDAYFTGDLPRSLREALDLFAAADKMQEILTPKFSEIYLAVKNLEHAEFLNEISPWEREHLLLNV
jgi:glutamine synthetase